MLIFALGIYRKWASRSPTCHTRNVIESLFLRPTVIVDDGLPEMIAVGQRFSGDCCASRVYGFEAEFRVVASAQHVHFGREFLFQGGQNVRGSAVGRLRLGKLLVGFFDLSGAFCSRSKGAYRRIPCGCSLTQSTGPWRDRSSCRAPHREIPCSWIASVMGFRGRTAGSLPFTACHIWIMMRSIDVLTGQVTDLPCRPERLKGSAPWQ